MNEFDARVFDLLEAFTPEVRHWPDWPDVLHRTRTRHTRRLVVALAAAVAVLGCAAGVTAALGGFDAWLSGSPGKPAPKAEQERFNTTNEHSIAAFPKSTKLRELIRTTVDGKVYVLFGFRSGSSLCLRLRAISLGHSLDPTCAPASRLVHATAPILPVVGVSGFDDKHAHPSAAVSYGIAADGVSRVVVRAIDGNHRAALGGNAYLWGSFDRSGCLPPRPRYRGNRGGRRGLRDTSRIRPSRGTCAARSAASDSTRFDES